MSKKDKAQGVVFVLPKSKEFFGRISKDFQRTGLLTQPVIDPRKLHQPATADQVADEQVEDLGELKEHLTKLSQLQKRLKSLLSEMDTLVKEDE
jgi:hypothetical protein